MAPSSRLLLLALALMAMGAAQGRRLRFACDPNKCVSQFGTFWRSTHITDPTKACDAIENSCCPACAKVWQPYVQPNYQTSPQNFFVYSGSGAGAGALQPPSAATNDHFLVVPNRPCRGVEDWHEPQKCHYEFVWDAAWAPITAAGPSQLHKKAMAINSQHYRTQHQIHVHVSDIQRGLGSWLQTNVPVDGAVHSYDCNAKGQVNALKCTAPAASGNTHVVCKKVAPGAGPSAASPFETAYTKSYNPAVGGTAQRGTLVYSPSADVFCVVTVDDRPVECLLYCATDCAGKIGAGCP